MRSEFKVFGFELSLLLKMYIRALWIQRSWFWMKFIIVSAHNKLNETRKFWLPIGLLTYLTNRQSEFLRLGHKSRVFKSQCNHTLTPDMGKKQPATLSNMGPNWRPFWDPTNSRALCYWGVLGWPLIELFLYRETPVSRYADAFFFLFPVCMTVRTHREIFSKSY